MSAHHADITGNRTLAARARAVADAAPRGSTDRKAALSAAVLLGETRTVAAARKLLGEVADPAIRQAAGELLSQLANQPQE